MCVEHVLCLCGICVCIVCGELCGVVCVCACVRARPSGVMYSLPVHDVVSAALPVK